MRVPVLAPVTACAHPRRAGLPARKQDPGNGIDSQFPAEKTENQGGSPGRPVRALTKACSFSLELLITEATPGLVQCRATDVHRGKAPLPPWESPELWFCPCVAGRTRTRHGTARGPGGGALCEISVHTLLCSWRFPFALGHVWLGLVLCHGCRGSHAGCLIFRSIHRLPVRLWVARASRTPRAAALTGQAFFSAGPGGGLLGQRATLVFIASGSTQPFQKSSEDKLVGKKKIWNTFAAQVSSWKSMLRATHRRAFCLGVDPKSTPHLQLGSPRDEMASAGRLGGPGSAGSREVHRGGPMSTDPVQGPSSRAPPAPSKSPW